MSATLQFPRLSSKRPHVLSLDVTLKDLTKVTQSLNVSENGKAFILTKDKKYVGLPKDSLFQTRKSLASGIMKNIDSIDIPSISNAMIGWENQTIIKKIHLNLNMMASLGGEK